MKKAAAVLMITLVSAAALTACSGRSSSSSGTGTSQTQTQAEGQNDTQTETTQNEDNAAAATTQKAQQTTGQEAQTTGQQAQATTQRAATAATEDANTAQTAQEGGGFETTETPAQPQNASSETTISTKYFTVTVPDDWSGIYEYTESDLDSGAYQLTFYEASDYESNGAGTVFSIEVFPDGVDYSYYPNYSDIGTLTASDGTVYHVITVNPSDVQFSEDNQSTYEQMQGEESTVASSITAADGYTYEAK